MKTLILVAVMAMSLVACNAQGGQVDPPPLTDDQRAAGQAMIATAQAVLDRAPRATTVPPTPTPTATPTPTPPPSSTGREAYRGGPVVTCEGAFRVNDLAPNGSRVLACHRNDDAVLWYFDPVVGIGPPTRVPPGYGACGLMEEPGVDIIACQRLPPRATPANNPR